MNYVFISPHFPSNFKNFAVGLKRAGVNVFGVASEPFELLDADLRESLTEYYRVNDMENYDEMLRAVAYLTYKHGKMDRIESHNEYWLAQDARLRTDFNVFGFKNEDMAFVKLKSAMKEKFREVGIRVARGRVIGDYHDALGLCHEYGFPVCIKPDSGVGAADTHKIRSEEELGHFFHVKNPYESYILEEFIDGKIVTYDGLTDAAGNILFDAHVGVRKSCVGNRRKECGYVLLCRPQYAGRLARNRNQARCRPSMSASVSSILSFSVYLTAALLPWKPTCVRLAGIRWTCGTGQMMSISMPLMEIWLRPVISRRR